MDRSLSHLRRTLLAVAFVGSLGFGATQALAGPTEADYLICNPTNGQDDAYCKAWCIQQGAVEGGCSPRSYTCLCLYP